MRYLVMQEFQIAQGYVNGRVKWCILCVENGVNDGRIVGEGFDDFDDAEAEIQRLNDGPLSSPVAA